MNVLLLDFEATSLDTSEARPLEIGAIITDGTFDESIDWMSELMWDSSYPALTPEVSKITNITQGMLLGDSRKPADVLCNLGLMAHSHNVGAVIAYNKAYDQGVMYSEVARLGIGKNPGVDHLLSVPWLCAMLDVEETVEITKGKYIKLMYAALEHGVTVNPKELHRALADVELMRKMLVAAGTTAGKMLAYAQEPWIYLRAHTTEPWKDGGRSNKVAKDLGFSWEQCPGDERKFSKQWVKRIKERKLEELMASPIKLSRLV